MGYDAALVSLDLARLYAQEGCVEDLKRLAAELMPVFESRDVHREALVALLMFQKACEEERLTVQDHGGGVFELVICYGFMEDPDVPAALVASCQRGLVIDETDITYFLGRETLIATETPGMALWRERLFVLMARNAVRATAFFRLPPERVVELGVQVEM